MTEKIETIIKSIKKNAKEYYAETGKPLGVTGEVGEVETSIILGLKLAPARQQGFDATDKNGKKVQIKSRCVYDNPKKSRRTGSLKIKTEWDYVLLSLLDESYNIYEIYIARRPELEKEIKKPGSKARNERETLSTNQFKRIAKLIWKKS
jgi:hypothetical protein